MGCSRSMCTQLRSTACLPPQKQNRFNSIAEMSGQVGIFRPRACCNFVWNSPFFCFKHHEKHFSFGILPTVNWHFSSQVSPYFNIYIYVYIIYINLAFKQENWMITFCKNRKLLFFPLPATLASLMSSTCSPEPSSQIKLAFPCGMAHKSLGPQHWSLLYPQGHFMRRYWILVDTAFLLQGKFNFLLLWSNLFAQ